MSDDDPKPLRPLRYWLRCHFCRAVVVAEKPAPAICPDCEAGFAKVTKDLIERN